MISFYLIKKKIDKTFIIIGIKYYMQIKNLYLRKNRQNFRSNTKITI